MRWKTKLNNENTPQNSQIRGFEQIWKPDIVIYLYIETRLYK